MLPSPRARRLYDSLPRNRAYLLTQLRTGHLWLATDAKRHKFRDDDKCQCGAKETVVHVLVDCPRLKSLRQILRGKIGEAFNNVSAILRGEGQSRQGQGKGGNVYYVLNAVLDFAEVRIESADITAVVIRISNWLNPNYIGLCTRGRPVGSSRDM
jgi:hypothetical protein